MCPLRWILVFFSAILAAYVAWRSVRSPSDDAHRDADVQTPSSEEKEAINLKRTIGNGFWVLVDMASGRYLWRNLKEMKQRSPVSC